MLAYVKDRLAKFGLALNEETWLLGNAGTLA
jgi:hypothetical protein